MNSVIRLRPLTAQDEETIANWPPYPAEFESLDYALRADGWLTEYGHRSDAWLYTAEHGGEPVAFSLLAMTASGEAEFRVALRADKTAIGLGRAVTQETLRQGFGARGLTRIHLMVRTNHPRAWALYRRLGFILRGECRQTVNRRPTDFYLMEILRPAYLASLDSTRHPIPPGATPKPPSG